MRTDTKKAKFLVVSAVALVFILVLILITLIAQKIQLNIKQKNLQERLDKLQQLKEDLGEETLDGNYRLIKEEIEKYLREQKGMIDAGDTVWKSGD